MRIPLIASVLLFAASLAMPADAQRIGRGRMIAPQISVPQGVVQSDIGQATPPRVDINQQRGGAPRERWSGQVSGRWIGGVQAPGGWPAYRRPSRGARLPSYWFAPSFTINDWVAYGLASPPYGYRWSRYYDDAVLLDGDGRVYDSMTGVNWDADYRAEHDDGDDRNNHDDHYQAQGGGYGAPYAAPYPPAGGRYFAPAPPPYAGAVTQPLYPHGYSQTWSAGSGYWYPGGVTTTITVQQAPVVTTTTTTEYFDETVYRAPVRHHYRKVVRRWVPKRRCTCTCGCR